MKKFIKIAGFMILGVVLAVIWNTFFYLVFGSY